MRGSKSGFTIVEILIAVVIISLTMVFVMQIFSVGIQFFLKCKDTTKMYYLAQSVMEEELYKPYPPSPFVFNTGWVQFDEPQNYQFRYRLLRQPVGNPANRTNGYNLIMVTLTVDGPFGVTGYDPSPGSWGDSMKTPRYNFYTVKTFMARRPFGTREVMYRTRPGVGDEWVIRYKDPSNVEIQDLVP